MRVRFHPLFAFILFGLLALHSSAAAGPAAPFDGQSWWAHVKVLADDNMEGRQTGSPGLERAEAYVVAQLQRAGVEPAGTEGFYQPVQFVQHQIDETHSSAALVQGGTVQPLDLGGDFYFSTKVDGVANDISAPLVFIGNGLRVPESQVDDLSGVDVQGKVVVLLAGSPSSVSAALAGHYSSTGERWKMLRAAGAIGMIAIPNPASMDIPWIRMSANRTLPTMDLDDPEFNEIAGLKVGMTFNPAQAEKLFAGSGHTFREIAILGKDRAVLPHFPLAVSLRAHAAIQETRLKSANVIGRLPGSDPKLKDEYVILTAHIDHLGVGAAVNGDRIYNGAMDDGSGCALLLDLAATLHAQKERPKRSLLFGFVCAEEKGLLGSKYYASHPTVPIGAIVADIHTDMFLPIAPARTIIVKGLAESDLGEKAAAVVRAWGVNPIADPEPLRNSFVRSDQYSFIRRGVPAVKLDYGAVPGTPEHAVFKAWLTQRYHAPSDDLNQPVDLAAAARYEEIIRQLALETANADARPQWKPDSFFRRYATSNDH